MLLPELGVFSSEFFKDLSEFDAFLEDFFLNDKKSYEIEFGGGRSFFDKVFLAFLDGGAVKSSVDN
jgi:hypothetical protein